MGKHRQYGSYTKLHSDGYLMTYLPTHPRASDGYVFDHILKAESVLGKPLKPGAVIHHYTPEQLVICENNGYHINLHRRIKMLRLCGHASWRWCKFCKTFDFPEKMIHLRRQYTMCHRLCINEYDRKRKKSIKEVNKNGTSN